MGVAVGLPTGTRTPPLSLIFPPVRTFKRVALSDTPKATPGLATWTLLKVTLKPPLGLIETILKNPVAKALVPHSFGPISSTLPLDGQLQIMTLTLATLQPEALLTVILCVPAAETYDGVATTVLIILSTNGLSSSWFPCPWAKCSPGPTITPPQTIRISAIITTHRFLLVFKASSDVLYLFMSPLFCLAASSTGRWQWY